jgi:hypothetical protein
MAENEHMFDNDDVFTKNNEIDETVKLNNSETLATQGNVINSLKIFWARLRAKLKYAVTRNDISEAVGTEYRPVYVDINGEVQPCNGLEKTVNSITNNNIDIGNISPIIGTTLYLKVNTSSTSNNSLKINNEKVFYPTGVEVKAKIDANTNLLVVYNGADWILINKINVVMASNKASEDGDGTGGNPGLMTADDKAKLNTIEWGANKYTYTLPTASDSEKGGVKSSSNNTTDSNNKIYHVGVNTNGIMTVNVPWENTHNKATLRVSNTSNGTQNSAATNGNMYLKIVDGTNISSLKISGSGDTTVTSDAYGNITISSPTVQTYNKLKNDDFSNNYIDSIGYLVYGPGENKANTSNFLAGNGTWQRGILVPIPNEEGKTLKSHSNGTVYWG